MPQIIFTGTITFQYVANVVVDPTPPPPIVYDQDYSHQIAVSGGTPPYSFAEIAGSWPTGISMSPDGLISGRATQVGPSGSFDMELEIRDSTP